MLLLPIFHDGVERTNIRMSIPRETRSHARHMVASSGIASLVVEVLNAG